MAPLRATAGEFDDPISVGSSPKGDPFRQFSDFLDWSSPVKRLYVISFALKNDLATAQIVVAILMSQHRITSVIGSNLKQSSTGNLSISPTIFLFY
jgi:hypothetical protein